MKRSKLPVEVLWCPNRSTPNRQNGWKFPPAVRRQILEDTEGRTVLHLFGGMANFGTLLDIDSLTYPDVIGDAWLPPFLRDSFDVVVLDPPYVGLNQQEKHQLLASAAWIARELVVWFHTIWIASDRRTHLEKAYLVRIGDSCYVRCLQYFRVNPEFKLPPPRYVTRGPAIKYNRWTMGCRPLAFDGEHARSTGTLESWLLNMLACPVCRKKVEPGRTGLACKECGRTFRVDDGIPVMLVDEATVSQTHQEGTYGEKEKEQATGP